VPTQCSSFRLLTLAGRYGMLSGSDCNNKRLREATGVKRRDTVGLPMLCQMPRIIAEIVGVCVAAEQKPGKLDFDVV
jgi:hypothetical protein